MIRRKAMMVGGTASHAGKSWMATAICAWLRRRGVRVAPFKAQNMSNNSYPCAGGGEIGRAQVAQAEACGLAPSVDMNPILLKPSGEMGSQVVVQGKVWRNLSAREYYTYHDYLSERVMESFERLSAAHEFIVIEGAGGLAELNLRRTDLVNLGLAKKVGAPVLLVADIDRGGVFASVYGTIALLPPEDAELIRAFAVNRFRGDPSLFADGAKLLEEKTARPSLGVFPYAPDIHLDQEDSVALDTLSARCSEGPPVAILRFPRISNHTDFRLLSGAAWIERPVARQFAAVILPGSKNSIADLQWLRAQGLDSWIRDQHAGGARILGICGGYQMMGERLNDPLHVESPEDSVEGLGLLPVSTTMLAEKVVRAVQARTRGGREFSAYEIHMGETTARESAQPLAFVDGQPEGMVRDNCYGTYLHGALENPDCVEEWLGFRPPEASSKQRSYDRLADWFERSADMALFTERFL